MKSQLLTLEEEEVLLVILDPNWADPITLKLTYPLFLEEGESGLTRRSPKQSGFSVSQEYSFLEEGVDLQGVRQAFGVIQNKRVAVPLWGERFTMGSADSRILEGAWVWNESKDEAMAETAASAGDVCYPLLVGTLEPPELSGETAGVASGTLIVKQDVAYPYRLKAVASDPGLWPWLPNWVEDITESIRWTHAWERLGRAAKSFLEGEPSTRRAQDAELLFRDRAEAAAFVAFWAARQGGWESFAAPAWLTPGTETPHAPHAFEGQGGVGKVRFATEGIELVYETPGVISTEITLEEEVVSESPQAFPPFAFLYELMRPLAYSEREIDVSSGSWWTTLATSFSGAPASFNIPSPPCGTASVRQLTANTTLNHHYVYSLVLDDRAISLRMAVWVYVPLANTVVNGIRFAGSGAFPWPEGNIDWTDLPRDRWVLCELAPLTPASRVMVIFPLSGSSKDFNGQDESLYFADFWAWPDGPRTFLTDWSEPIQAAGVTWNPANLEHQRIKQSRKLEDEEVEFQIALEDAPILEPLVRGEIASSVLCKIYELDLSQSILTPEFLYGGRVGVERVLGRVVKCKLSSFYGLLKRRFPRFAISPYCNYQFCDVNCGLIEGNYLTTGGFVGLDSESSYVVVLDTLQFAATVPGEVPDGYWRGGKLETGEAGKRQFRTIKGSWWNSEGEVLTVETNLPLRTDLMEVGQPVSLLPGCDGTKTACTAYGNFANFGGAPHIPPYLAQAPQSTPKGGK